MLKKNHDYQSAAHVKVIPGELGLLWQVGSCSWLHSYDCQCNHSSDKVKIKKTQFILSLSSHFHNTYIQSHSQFCVKQTAVSNTDYHATCQQ